MIMVFEISQRLQVGNFSVFDNSEEPNKKHRKLQLRVLWQKNYIEPLNLKFHERPSSQFLGSTSSAYTAITTQTMYI
jgi:hypothetical protein